MRAPVLWLPLVALAPLQPPEAVHAVALVELHVSVDAPPLATRGDSPSRWPSRRAVTVTVAVATGWCRPDRCRSANTTCVAVSAPVLCVPLVALAPLQPPEAVHDVALVELHVSVEAPPLATRGRIRRQRDGRGPAATVTVAVATWAGAARTGAGQRIRRASP